MRRVCSAVSFIAILLSMAAPVAAQPTFVNGLVIPGDELDATRQAGANTGRLGMFSDLYYDPLRDEWWALSDRGPGGGLLDYSTRVQRFRVQVHPHTGRINNFKVLDTIKFTDPNGLLTPPAAGVGEPGALNGLNPFLLNANASQIGRSFDPEGLAIDPTSGHLLVADEYRPALYEFGRDGVLLAIFETPANLVPRVKVASPPSDTVNYVAIRDACGSGAPPLQPPLCGLNVGRQDNRGYEGLAISPNGKRLYAVLQDPRTNEDGKTLMDDVDTDGRNGRNVRIVVFDNDPASATYRRSVAQYVYQLEPQADVLNRILGAGGTGTSDDPRQGRNIGVSAIIAINDRQFLVLERDNRGIGVDNPAGVPGALGVTGSKRIFKVDIPANVTDVTLLPLPRLTLPADVIPLTKSAQPFIDLVSNTLLPNGNQAEKWEGVTIGPELKDGSHLILVGNDNDYSVTQSGSGEQFDIFVDFDGHFAKCVIDDESTCIVDPANVMDPIVNPVPRPQGFSRLPGILHAYKASAAQLGSYVPPTGD